MAEYSSLKVPELKKLLAEKGLPQTGNKADLIARLQENDQQGAEAAPEKPAESKEDEITYSDDDAAKPAAAAAQPAEAAVPVTESRPADAAAEAPADAAPVKDGAEEKAPAPSFAMGLSSTSVDDEARKRAERMKRFGLEEDDESKKLNDRAKRFGIDAGSLAKGLDSALPERPLKRGRGAAVVVDGGNRPGKRQSLDRRGGGRGGRHGRGPRPQGGNAPAERRANIMDDPAEKAKAEKRAARFASG